MIRFRSTAAITLLTLTAGCVGPAGSDGAADVVRAHVTITTHTIRGAEVVSVQAQFAPRGGRGRIDFANDTLRVQGVPGRKLLDLGYAFSADVPLDSMARARGIHVRLPDPQLWPLPVQEFTLFSVARGGPSTVDLRAGDNLSLPVVRGASGTLPPLNDERWNVELFRGDRQISIGGNGRIPSPLVVPWSLIPDRPADDTISVRVTSTRQYVMPGTGGPTYMFVTADARLEWDVHVVPAQPSPPGAPER